MYRDMASLSSAFPFLMIFCFHCHSYGQLTSPQMPQIPETYTTQQMMVQLIGVESVRQVVVYRNFEAGKQLVISTINGNDSLGYVDVLTRVDLKRKFQYFLPYEYCFDISKGGVTIDRAWNWMMNSTYKEQRIFNRQIVNVWAYEDKNFYYEVGVLLADANLPVFYFKADEEAQSATLVTFKKFTAKPPEDFIFDVPQVCQYKLD